MTVSLFITPRTWLSAFLKSRCLTSCFLGGFAPKSAGFYLFLPLTRATGNSMAQALWSSILWWSIWRTASHVFNYHEKRSFTCSSSQHKFNNNNNKEQLQYKMPPIQVEHYALFSGGKNQPLQVLLKHFTNKNVKFNLCHPDEGETSLELKLSEKWYSQKRQYALMNVF